MKQNHILKKLFAVCFGWLPKTRTLKTQKNSNVVKQNKFAAVCFLFPPQRIAPQLGYVVRNM